MNFLPGQRIHFVGIGGFGMSAIARVLLLRGYAVTGSDRGSNALTEALARDGALIHLGHDAAYVTGADMVITTSAAPHDHIEITAARESGIPVYKRDEVIGPLLSGHTVIAVAGTHGKTTTTSMVVHILQACGLDPGYIVGGVMGNTGTNAGVGQGKYFVIEADEYDNMFHGLTPDTAIVTSVEYDHPDFFKTEADMLASFAGFLARIRPGGALIACVESDTLLDLARDLQGVEIIPYAAQPFPENGAAGGMRAVNIRVESGLQDGHTTFDVTGPDGLLGSVRLSVPGRHNVLNALAALTAALRAGCPFDPAAAALATFRSAGRRFDLRGVCDGVLVFDDYAHHPTAIRVTLEAARARYPEHTLWAVWQPHMYSRTRQLIDAYAGAFASADHILVTDIYAAREEPIPGVDGAWTARQIQHADARHVSGLEAAASLLAAEAQAPAVIVVMSAGDAIKISAQFLALRGNGVIHAGTGT